MSKKEPSNAQILDILDTHSTVLGNHTQMIETNRKAIEANGKSIGNIKEQVALIHIKLAEHDRRFEVLEERTAYLPKLYEAVDAFMVEIQENRQGTSPYV